MVTSKFRPEEIPDQASGELREYLDRTLAQMAVLLDGAADYLDDSTIAHTDADETITGDWIFSGPGPTFQDGNAFTIDPVTGSGDIRWESSGVLKALCRWDSTANTLTFQDRDPSAVARIYMDLDNSWMRVYASGETTDYTQISGSQILFYEDAGDGLANIDFDVNDGVSACTLRFGRSTNVTKTHDTTWYRGDGTTTAFFRLRYDNAGALGEAELLQGTKLALYSAGNADQLDIYMDGSNLLFDEVSGATGGVLFRDGLDLYVYDESNSEYGQLYHDGTDWHTRYGGSGTTWHRYNSGNDGVSGKLNLYGMEERWYDSDNTESVGISHTGTYGLIGPFNASASHVAMKFCGATGHATWPGIQILDMRLLADDGSDSWTIECDGGIYWLIGGTTSQTEAQYIGAFWDDTTTHVTIATNNAAVYSLGTGTNPNVDGDTNIWFTNGGKTMNIKNRRGSSRYYSVYIMSGRS